MNNVTIQFEESELLRSLTQLPRNMRVAFAAACAERQFPACEFYCEQQSLEGYIVIRGVLDRVWLSTTGVAVKSDVKADIENCMKLIPDEENADNWSFAMTYSSDAVSSAVYALRTLQTGDPQEAISAASCPYEAICHYVTDLLTEDYFSPAALADVLSHPLVQAELSRQRYDIEELLSAKSDNQSVVTNVKARATRDSRIFFGA